MTPEIRMVAVASLIPYARNARTHSEDQVAQIAASIAEFGFTNPILTDGERGVIAGHGRLAAARKLELTEVPVIELTHLSAIQKKAYILADNRIAANAGWDDELLGVELTELKEAGFDLELMGFGDEELERLLNGEGDKTGLTEDDAVPDLPVDPVSKTGDMWLLGQHRLLCGDSTVLTDVERVMNGQLADMAFTDPPYNVDYGNNAKDKMRGKDRRIMNDALGDGFYQFLYDACVNLLLVTKGACYVCMSSSELHTLQRAWLEAGGKWSTFVIWAKNTFTLGRADYQRQYEPILYGWKEGTKHFWCGDRDQSDIWNYNKPRVNDLHPTMKPVELVERAIKNSSKTRDIVLDLFGGSGTTLIACEKTNRQARLVELDPKYVDVIVKRWEDYTGLKASRESDGQAFAELTPQALSEAQTVVMGETL
ncbi:site-specific DNA-methyltransferase [Zwartia panacis]|uniref:site-specific DNA-methyltransferase n=1 Tax=Zwartia panacis TaxID=2683345 RepID=UPI0025B55070|nr:site-specific DNA-methyltransferase [Zwartia panacis]MDN4015878.1 site-specific DNA-methyltransferase [Zwartia panacis]